MEAISFSDLIKLWKYPIDYAQGTQTLWSQILEYMLNKAAVSLGRHRSSVLF